MDIINVRSEKGLVLSSGQISGELGERISVLRENIIGLLASVEVAIDYPDEESEHVSGEESARQLEKEIIAPIKEIISAHARRKAWVEGISTAIVGRVNAGKSSLLNRLSNEQRSIVTSIPGTTRDIIESTLYIKGLPLRLMDTAGIREGNDEVEKIGIRLSEQKLAEADLALAVIDRSRPLDHNDRRVLSMLNRDNSIIIINKTDLPSGLDEALLYELANGMPIAPISVLTGNGVEHLCDLIVDKALENEMDTGFEKLAPNLRHKKALCEAAEYFEQAAQNLKKGAPMEIISVDLKAGLDHLGEITGATTNEELYDRIFSQFCLGK
jgi:tRNA modification GTPase